MCHHDDLAPNVLAELQAAGRAVPGEAAVVGYDPDPAEALDLTSLRQPFAETERIATSLLFAAMDGTSGSTQQMSPKPRLTIGGATLTSAPVNSQSSRRYRLSRAQHQAMSA